MKQHNFFFTNLTPKIIYFFLTLCFSVIHQKGLSQTTCSALGEISLSDPILFPKVGTSASQWGGEMMNEDIQMSGDFIVDVPFEFANCTLRISNDCKFLVNPNISVTFDNCVLFSEGTDMWSGISLEHDATLNLSNCHIEDAISAVNAPWGGGEELSIVNCCFNKNYIAISANNLLQPSPASPISFTNFQGNTISCTENLNRTINGNATSFAGISIFGRNTSIGNGGILNRIQHQRHGFRIENSVVGIQFCRLLDNIDGVFANSSSLQITGNGFSPPFSAFENNQDGIRAVSSPLSVTNCYFIDNLSHDIYLTGKISRSIINIYDNQFDRFIQVPNDNFSCAILLGGDVQLICPIVKINSNEFNWNDSDGYLIVSTGNNVFTNLYEIGGNDASILRIFEGIETQMGGSSGRIWIHDNNIWVEDYDATGVFHFHNVKNPASKVENNHVYGDENFAVSKSYYSVNSGIKWCENSSDFAETGFYFEGVPIIEIEFAKSSIGLHGKGLRINNGSFIGEQDRTGNCWLNYDPNFVGNAAHHYGNPTLSEFIVDQNIICHFPEGSINPASGWFYETGIGEIGCGRSIQINKLDKNIAGSEYGTNLPDAAMLWNLQRFLFQKLSLHPELVGYDSTITAFYEYHLLNNVGKFQQVENQVSSASVISEEHLSQILTNQSKISNKFLQLASLDSLIRIFPQNINFRNEREVILDSIQILSDFSNALGLLIESERNVLLSLALAANNNLIAEDIFQENEKIVHSIQLDWLANPLQTPTEVQLNLLRAIAEQCPLIGGRFVNEAQNMLPNIENRAYELQEYNANCLGQRIELSESNSDKSIAQQIQIFPNPTNHLLYLAGLGAEEVLIKVVDIYGKVILFQPIESNSGEIILDFAGFHSGIYQIAIQNAKGEITNSARFVFQN